MGVVKITKSRRVLLSIADLELMKKKLWAGKLNSINAKATTGLFILEENPYDKKHALLSWTGECK